MLPLAVIVLAIGFYIGSRETPKERLLRKIRALVASRRNVKSNRYYVLLSAKGDVWFADSFPTIGEASDYGDSNLHENYLVIDSEQYK